MMGRVEEMENHHGKVRRLLAGLIVGVFSLWLGCQALIERSDGPVSTAKDAKAPDAAPSSWVPPDVPEELAGFTGGRSSVPVPETDIRFPHALHLGEEVGLECTDCHEGAEATPKAGIPAKTVCIDCHEGIEKNAPPGEGSRTCHVRDDLRVARLRPPAYEDLAFDHGKHKSAGIDCIRCHGDVTKAADHAGIGPFPAMTTCFACHEEKKAPTDCATCHVKTRIETPPQSHQEVAWRSGHGAVWALAAAQSAGDPARCDHCHQVADCSRCHQVTPPADHELKQDWRLAHGRVVRENDSSPARCALCHSKEACAACHATTPPATHKTTGWRSIHGMEAALGSVSSYSSGTCAACHAKNFCDRCHQSEEPRDHTNHWRQVAHGVEAGISRDRCVVCHQGDFCERCHTRVEPTSHNLLFIRAPLALHCVTCHQPLSQNGCAACHRRAPHLLAPGRPANPPHGGFTESACRLCHGSTLPVPHPDNGPCTSCHR